MVLFKSPFEDVALRDLTVTERVFEGLTYRPDDIVVIEGPTGRGTTARSLMTDIKRLAGGLNELGKGTGHTLAILAPNMPEYCVAFHGAVWAGGTVTTINPTYTVHEIRHQLKDSGAQMLVTIPTLAEQAKAAAQGTDVSQIVLIGEEQIEGTMPLLELMGPVQEQQTPVDLDRHVAALPYSSGTTGLPKGVMLSHRNLVVNMDQTKVLRDIRPNDATPAFLPFFHIYGLAVMMNQFLASGGLLVTLPRFELELYLQIAEKYRARTLWVVPPIALALAKSPSVDDYDLSALENVVCAAAPLGPELEETLARRLNCICTQGFGMTELGPASHTTPKDAPRAGSVGLTLPSTECRIVDVDTGEDLGVDGEGELWVRGPQVMIGYHANPEATNDTIDPESWLHTGDVGCFDSDGYLYIRDRLKELIKFKGFQVAPAELESVLVTSPAIADAAVIGIPDDDAGEVPIAFIVGAENQFPSREDVMAHLTEHLSSYKQVHQVHFVDQIPKSPSGKILRRVLKDQLAQNGTEIR